MVVSERYSPVVVGVNATVSSSNIASLAGFLCVTAGSISLSSLGEGPILNNGQTLFTSLPVVAGVYYPIPFRVNGGYSLVASGGASGVLGVV